MSNASEEGQREFTGLNVKELVDRIYQEGKEAERKKWEPLALAILHTMNAVLDFPDVPDKDDRRRLKAISGVMQRAHDLIPDVIPYYKIAREQEAVHEAEALLKR